MPPKDSCRLLWLLWRNLSHCIRLLDSLSLSRHGESSSEPGSVMILNPMFGNSLWKAPVCRTVKHHMSNKLFVGNLSFDTTENDLQDAFAAFGTVNETNLMMDRGPRPLPRFGFHHHEHRRRGPEGHRRHERQGHGRSRPHRQRGQAPRRAPGGGGGGRREYGGSGGGAPQPLLIIGSNFTAGFGSNRTPPFRLRRPGAVCRPRLSLQARSFSNA